MADLAVAARSIRGDPVEPAFRERNIVETGLRIPPRGKEAE
jgi:hypothetical protein